MKTSVRILRGMAESTPGVKITLSERDQQRRQDVLACARRMLVDKGPPNVGLHDIAASMRLPRGVIIRLFADMDDLMGTIIMDHLLQVSNAMLEARSCYPGATMPELEAASRAAYVRATRTGLGALIPAHEIYVLHRHSLPEDLQELIGHYRRTMGFNVAGKFNPLLTLDLLDNPRLILREIEGILSNMALWEPPRMNEYYPKPRPLTPREKADRALRDKEQAEAAAALGDWKIRQHKPDPRFARKTDAALERLAANAYDEPAKTGTG